MTDCKLDSKLDSNADCKLDSNADSKIDSKLDSNADSKLNCDIKEENEYLQDIRKKQRLVYIEQEKEMKHKNRLAQLKKRNYFLPKDLLNIVLSYIPGYNIIWFSNGEFNLSINCISLHDEFTQNIGKVIYDRNSFIHHEINCECHICDLYNSINRTIRGISEYQIFNFIANAMGVQIAKICPNECYNDYTQFKSNDPDIKKRIADYFYADWHKDSRLNLHISWMRIACGNRIEFCYELMPEYYQWVDRKRYYITYECIESFIKKLLKVPKNLIDSPTDSDHIKNINDIYIRCQTTTPFIKMEYMIAKAYRYMAYEIDFIRRNPDVLENSVKKAYAFKDTTDNIRVHLSINSYLNLLGLG